MKHERGGAGCGSCKWFYFQLNLPQNVEALNRQGTECGLPQRLTPKLGGLSYFESHFALQSKRVWLSGFICNNPFKRATDIIQLALTFTGVFISFDGVCICAMQCNAWKREQEFQARPPFQVGWLYFETWWAGLL